MATIVTIIIGVTYLLGKRNDLPHELCFAGWWRERKLPHFFPAKNLRNARWNIIIASEILEYLTLHTNIEYHYL